MFYLIIISINIVLSQITKIHNLFINTINPLFWIVLSIVVLLTVPKKYINLKQDVQIITYSLIAGLSYIIINFLLGLVVTYGKNPYSSSVLGILMNFWVTGIAIIGKEYVRYKILTFTPRKNIKKISILIIIVYTVLELNIIKFITSFVDISSSFRQIVENLIPIIIKNILFTQITVKYSYKAPIVYELTINIFYWIAPILPNSPWILVAILDIIIPFLLYVVIKNKIDNSRMPLNMRNREVKDPINTLVFGFSLIMVACFAVGLFPIQPRAVATGSMYPELSVGDIVLIKKCSINDVKVGEIIQYQIENQYIIHRILKISTENGLVAIITKGDNNSSEDAKPITDEQLVGKVIFKIKYLGIPSVWLHQITNSNEKALVETGN